MTLRPKSMLGTFSRSAFCVASLAIAAMTGCHKVVNIEDPSIEITRDVHFEGLVGDPAAITSAPGGGFVVVGQAWAIGTDANGQERWRFTDSDPDALKAGNRAEYEGAVATSAGNTLLCGLEWTKHGTTGLLTILNSAGQLTEKRLVQPATPAQLDAVTIYRCLRWGDGIAVLGHFSYKNGNFGWLMKLDATGAKQWEVVDERLSGISAVQMADGSMAMATMEISPDRTSLVQVNAQGQITLTKTLTSFPDAMIRSVGPAPNMKMLANIDRKNYSVLTLDKHFESIAEPIAANVMTGKGCAWSLSDGGVALFGNIFVGGVYQAAVGRIAQRDKPDAVRALPVPSPGGASTSVYDAIPIGDRTFVVARDVNNGLGLSWITFK